jgi:hypothetical protein
MLIKCGGNSDLYISERHALMISSFRFRHIYICELNI